MIINSVIAQGGIQPSGTKSITANGVYDITDFASADVQVPTTAPEIYRVFRVNNGKIENSISTPFLPLPSTATDIGNSCYALAYSNTPASVLSGAIDLSGLTTISGYTACDNMFSGCTGITSVNLSSLITISGQNACSSMFYNCDGITSVNLSSLTTISGNSACSTMFYNCDGITSVNLSSLTTLSSNSACTSMFSNCNGITSIDLSSLTTISGYAACSTMFFNCTGLTSVDLSSLTTISGNNACQGMFSNCTGLATAKFNALNTISVQIAPSYGTVFADCSELESVEFGGLTSSTFASRKDQIAYLFTSTTGSQAPNGCTVHFPSNFDPSDPNHTFDTSTLTGYPTFGGNASYIHVAFDLPATE